MKTSVIVFLLAFISLNVNATIRTVKLQCGTVNAAQNLGRELTVSSSRVQGFRVPFVTGNSHIVHIKGAFVDICDRVEICNSSSTVIRTLTGSALNKFKASNEGNIKFTVSSGDLPGVDQDFIIRLRYAVELNGFDRLDCKVAARGVINSIQWIGTNQPLILSVTGGEHSVLKKNLEYTLQFNGTGFGNSIQLFDGKQTDLYNKSALPFTSSNLSVNSEGTVITLKFTPTGTTSFETDLENFTNSTSNLLFAFGGVGNISGGWGSYLYADYNNLISTAGALTDLQKITVANPSDFNPELVIFDVKNKFLTNSQQGQQFNAKDLQNFALCNSSGGNIKITTIPGLVITIKNSGFAASPAFNLSVRNFDGTGQQQNIAVPAIPANSSVNVTFNRPENRVCGAGTGSSVNTCLRCNNVQSNNLPLWTDTGVILQIPAIANEQNPNNNTLQL